MKANRIMQSAGYVLISFFLFACSQESTPESTAENATESSSAATSAPETAASADASALDTIAERAGYALGVNIGMGIQGQGFEGDISVESLIEGLQDTLADELKLSNEELTAAIQEFTAMQEAKFQEQMEAEAADQRQFLVDNATEEGVVTTPSGLQYMVLEEGPDDGLSPTETDTVTVHYTGTLIDGTVFDSSVERGEPLSFPLNGVIAGWTEGVQLMTVGDKYRFFIPSELGYGPAGAGGAIGPNATLIFEVELLGIE